MDITSEDRKKIYAACISSKIDKIIITHGTDTMVETAKSLASIKGKTMIITGAIRPERFSNTDAYFNIGVAVGAIQSLREGTYIAMNGKVYAYDNVQKHPKTGQFVEN